MKKSLKQSKIESRPSSNQRGIVWCIGIDEVGRGPWAGPVVLGVAAYPISKRRHFNRLYKGVKESKQLSEDKREYWYQRMYSVLSSDSTKGVSAANMDGVAIFCTAFRSAYFIDTHGISQAIQQALDEALNTISKYIKKQGGTIGDIRLDGGLHAPPSYKDQKTIIKGDAKESIIALASIAAKVERDRYMKDTAATEYPDYGFDIHKGYGTALHKKALLKHGISPLHRKTFIHFLD